MDFVGNILSYAGSPKRPLQMQVPETTDRLNLSTVYLLQYYLWDTIWATCDDNNAPMSWQAIEAIDLHNRLPVHEKESSHRLLDSNFMRTQLDELIREGYIIKEAPEITPEVASANGKETENKTPNKRGRSPGRGKAKTSLRAVPAPPPRDDHRYRHNPDKAMDPPYNVSPSARSRRVLTPFKRLQNSVRSVFGSIAFLGASESSDALDDTQKQTEEAAKPGTLPFCIRHGRKEEALQLIRKDVDLLRVRGAVGELPIHYCFLLGGDGGHPSNLDLGFEMLKRDKHLIDTQYEGQEDKEGRVHVSPYEGENILHIAIINQLPMEVINRLLAAPGGKRLLNQGATGSFFKDDYFKKDTFGAHDDPLFGQCYLGELPLFFAIATNQFGIFEALVDAGANLNAVDSNGNNILHVLVILQNFDAYAYFKKRWVAFHYPGRWTKADEALDLLIDEEGMTVGKDAQVEPFTKEPLVVPWKQRNLCGLTPFTLAADRGLQTIFEKLIEEESKIEWVYGKVTCKVYPLDNGLDNISSAARGRHHKSALELIIQKGHMNFFTNTRIKDLFERKWNKFANAKVFSQWSLVIVYLIVLVLFCINRQNFRKQYGHDGALVSVSHLSLDFVLLYAMPLAVVILGALWVALIEVQKIATMGLTFYRNQPWVSFAKSLMSLLFFFCIAAFSYCNVTNSEGWEQFWLGLACPVAYSSLFFFLLAWEYTGPLVLMIVEMLVNDVMRFLRIYLVFLCGFSQAFFVLDNRKDGLFGLHFGAVKLFETTLGNFQLDDAIGLNALLIVFFVVIVAVLMLNLLIAMMGATYGKVQQEAEMRWQMERARIISAIESEMTPQQRMKKENTYFITVAGNRYLQIYDVNPDHFGPKKGEDKR